jgi:DNA-directed RNA polymerase subunit K/omega
MNFKNAEAEKTTVTRDLTPLKNVTGNLYQSIVAISKRANQINVELKEELGQKLEDFSTHTDNLEEIFENREQIEISKIYEKLPKPTAFAIEELKTGKLSIKKD